MHGTLPWNRGDAAGEGHRFAARCMACKARRHAWRRPVVRDGATSRSTKFSFKRDAFVHELVDSIIGDNYPVPDRMLVHNEQIVHEYLMWAMCGEPRPSGKFDLYAVEGGTAAMCYIFKSLKANRLLFPGDTIALGTPIFTPYLEMTHLEDYSLKVVNDRCAAGKSVPIHRRRDQEARGSQDQGLLRRESRQSHGHGDG